MYYEKLLSLRKARTFGAPGHYLIASVDRSKLGDNSRQCRFLGGLPRGNGWRVLVNLTWRVVKTRDVFFDEQAQVKYSSVSPLPPPPPASAPYLEPDTSAVAYPPHADEQAHQPDQPPVEPRARCQRRQTKRYGNLRVHSATADSPTYKQALNSHEASDCHGAWSVRWKTWRV